ncbi:MAG: hypothetical protein Q9195_003641 [Heterodermia aff. obscurata]
MDAWSVKPGYVPRRLYRVDYEDAWSEYIPELGFQAATTTHEHLLADYPALFIESLENHLDWKSRVPSPYISLFSQKLHAENWALKWMERHPGKECCVFEINGMKLDRACLFRPYSMGDSLGADSWVDPHEYLCLHFVPEDAIIASWCLELDVLEYDEY